jgi:hypothetical protein
MTRRTHNPKPAAPLKHAGLRRRARGAVMTELVLVLPLILVLLSLLFYFGRGFVRMQHAGGMERYEAFRRAEHAPGPRGFTTPRDNPQLDEVFFGGGASSISLRVDRAFPPEASDALITAASRYDENARRYGQELFAQLPAGVRVRFETEHAETNDFWRRFAGPIRHEYTRIGNDWRFVNGVRLVDDADGAGVWRPGGAGVSNTRVLRDAFFLEFDERLAAEADRGTGLAETIRRFYLHQPGYAGPDLPQSWFPQ